MREEAQRPEAVIHRDDDRSLGRQVLTVIPGETARSASEAATVDPHHHGTTIVRVARARPDVEIQTVFGARRLTRWWSRCCRCGCARRSARCRSAAAASPTARRTCGARSAERVRLPHALPLGDRLWRLPAVLTDWWRSERNPLEHAHARLAARGSFDDAGINLHLRRNHRPQLRR